MSLTYVIILMGLAAVAEASVLPQIRIGQGQPDLVFLLVLSWAANNELEEGVNWAFIGGIAKDLLSAAPLGTSTLGYLLVVFGISGLGRQVYRMGLLLLIGLVIVGTLIQQVVSIVVLAIAGEPVNLLQGIQQVVLPTLLYNLIFIWPVYGFIRLIQNWLGTPVR
ncbi:MAG: rod shape-determining protein MreD [Chloroflexi bacterium]|nr:MAG: rod shape-determining protein MreD [Chloroflexota bacterium]